MLFSLWLLVRYASRVYSRFRLPKGHVVTGKFEGSSTEGPAESGLISNEQMAIAGTGEGL